MSDIKSLGLGKISGSTGSLVGQAADMVSGLLPSPSEYSGDKGGITLGIDQGYNKISDVAMQINPVVGGAMKAAGMLGKGINALGGGTDGMTTTDAILGSGVGTFLTLGVNGFFGKKSDIMSRDEEAFGTVGSSYEGLSNGVDDAVHKAGKKYGLFSSSARKKANKLIHNMGLLQTTMADIAQDTTMNNEMLANQTAMSGYASAFESNGGYDMSTARAAKYGMKFSITNVNRARNIINNKISIMALGGNINSEEPEVSTKLSDLINTPLPKRYSRAIKLAKQGTKTKKPFIANFDFENTPLLMGHENDDPSYISILNLQRLQELNAKLLEDSNRSGGGFSHSISDIDKTVTVNGVPYIYKGIDETGKELYVGLDGGAYYFKEGGAMNVIPEGALHAHKNNMEGAGKDFTKKGIPVVIEEEGGDLNQQAEIERNEIIFNLEVTKKLEELNKIYQSEETSQKEKDEAAILAGKLLTKEILTNTDDRTGLIQTIV